MGRWGVRRATLMFALMTASIMAAADAAPTPAATRSATFTFTGAEASFVIPADVTLVHVSAVGGNGGVGGDRRFDFTTFAGGPGARVEADLAVTPGERLYVEVGGNGEVSSLTEQGAIQGGWNGGASAYGFGAGGGGASDVRTCARADAGCSTLASRLLVAGGGGGGANGVGGASAHDGAQGDPADGSFSSVIGQGGAGGTQTAGGAGGLGGNQNGGDGTLGEGGHGGDSRGGNSVNGSGTDGGGGGGGLYGGGGGGSGAGRGGGGGGGSSYADPARVTDASFAAASDGTAPSVTFSWDVPAAPQATTSPASDVGQSGATLNGVVNPGGLQTSYHFDYGTDPGQLTSHTPEQTLPAGRANASVEATVAGLAAGTTYHFQLVAANTAGDGAGQVRSFTTQRAADACAGGPSPQVIVDDSGYRPARITLPFASTVNWCFAGTRPHTVTDRTGLLLFDSGPRVTGSFSQLFRAAGAYRYGSTAAEPSPFTGRVIVPLSVSPATGPVSRQYTVSWAADTQTGYVEDVDFRYHASGRSFGAWTSWQNASHAASAAFAPTRGTGTYQFRARLHRQGTPATSGWSPAAALSVH
jgi:adhesin/invasin